MKKLILASCMLMAFAGFASAQTAPKTERHTKTKTTHQTHSKTMGSGAKAHKGMMKDSTSTVTMHKKTTKKKS